FSLKRFGQIHREFLRKLNLKSFAQVESPNTAFLALSCFSGIMERSDGTPAPAIFPGRRRSVELHQGRCAASGRATRVEPTGAGFGGRNRRGPPASESARC